MVDEQARRARGDRRRGVGMTVVVMAAHAREQHPGRDQAGIVRHPRDHHRRVTDDPSAEWTGDDIGQRPKIDGVAPHRRDHSGQPVEPAGGRMPSSWTIVGASSRNTGAETVPPKRSVASELRSSIEIRIVTCGSSAGRNPTKLA